MITPFDLVQALRSWFFARDGDVVLQSGRKIAVDSANIEISGGNLTITTGNITITGTVDGIDISAHAADSDAHHNEAHTVASHSDTTGTGSELNTLTDGSNADSLHSHSAVGSHTIASHSDTTATGSELNTLTDGSDASSLHDHDGRYFQESEFTSNPGSNSKPLESNSNGYLELEALAVGTSSPSSENISTSGSLTATGDVRGAGYIRSGNGITVGNSSQDSIFGAILLRERSGAAGTPPSGYGYIWCENDGNLYFKNDGGTETQLT